MVLLFFFQKSNQAAENSAIAALRTITSQLVRQEPRVLPILLKRHEKLSVRGDFEWSWKNLLSVLTEMMARMPPSLRIYIILDAVDECEAKSRTLILDWVKGLDDDAASTVSMSYRPVLKVLVTSRPDGNIPDCLSRLPTLAITNVDTADDMRALIHSRMDELARQRHLNRDITRRIAVFLEENAHGMFLWVVLVLKELEKRDERLSDETIASKLSRMPRTLVDTYEAILLNICPTRKDDFWRIMRWLIFGTRGVTLTELETGLCLETGVSSWHDLDGDVKFLCGSLIRFDGPRQEIKFVHQTARGFFETFIGNPSTADVVGLDMDAHAANEHLATICVQYLLRQDEFLELSRLLVQIRDCSVRNFKSLTDFLHRNPFLRYAIESWAAHIQAAGTPSTAIHAMVSKLLSSPMHRDGIKTLTGFISKHLVWRVRKPPSPIHLAAYFNIPWLVESYILQSGISVIHIVGCMNDTPLIWASEMGSTESVEMLLDAGADPNKFEVDGWSALHWAARNGHLGVATLLLENGAHLEQEDSGRHTALDWAYDREHWDVVRALEQWTDKNQFDKSGNSYQQKYSKRKTRNVRIRGNPRQLWDSRHDTG